MMIEETICRSFRMKEPYPTKSETQAAGGKMWYCFGMNLYTVHQPDPGAWDQEYEYWEAIWARDPEEAKAIYVAYYQGECDPRNADFGDGVAVALKDIPAGTEPKENGPHFERRSTVLREIGFACPGETACENCGRYALDFDDWRVCRECYMCEECGHQEDCKREEPHE